MIKAIFIVINGAFAFSRQYTEQIDPHMLSGLLTAFRVSSKEFASGNFRQAKFEGSEVLVDGLTERPNDFVAIFATPDERTIDLTNLMALVKTAFIGNYGEKIHTWSSLDGTFNEFEPMIDQIIAGCVWCDTEEVISPPKVTFTTDIIPAKETVFRGNALEVKYFIHNLSEQPIRLTAIVNAIPHLFELEGVTRNIVLRGTTFLRNHKLKPEEEYETVLPIKARRIGHTTIAPILFVTQSGQAFTILGEHREIDII
ncbi:MAG: hypothetical protein ACFFD8_05010 [Candidatus Thorarchaeota archaeon]